MADARLCPECGRPLAPDALPGSCPACLLRKGLEPPSETSYPAGAGPFDVSYGLEPTDVGHVIDALARSIGPIPRVLLPDTAEDDRGMPVIKPSSPEMPSPSGRGERYQLFGEIARGGMGAVLKGRDTDLGRDLAVKVLLADHQDKPELIRRFVEEAQIGGQLQHPGIVPVYELGTFAGGRPYFSMKLVKGRTLAALLNERDDPQAERPRFVSIFEAVCQTVAYAHARGVIHRDLKPSNVMVGSFGEVQVMDWGLAKVLKEGGVQDEPPAATRPDASVIATVRSGSDLEDSQAGTLMGTPAYMAPEQADGQVGRIDRRADVFGLGSILCEVLTGQPAFTGRTQAEVVRKALRGDLAEAMAALGACGAEPELVALARDCLAVEPQDRPRDAGVVAGRVTAYLASVQERLRTAELARATEAARAEEAQARVAVERSRRRRTVALAASVLALTTLGGLSLTYLLQQRQARLAAADRLLGEATTLLDHARTRPDDPARWQAALAAAHQTDTAGLPPEARGRLATLTRDIEAGDAAARADQELLARLVRIRSVGAESLGDYDVPDGSIHDAAYEEAFRGAGIDVDALGPVAVGAKIRSRPESVALALAAALDDWASQRRKARRGDEAAWRRLVAAARAADPDPRRDELRANWEQLNRSARLEPLRTLSARPDVEGWPAATLNLLAGGLAEAGDVDAAVTLLRRAVARHPGDVSINFNLARRLQQARPPRHDEAIRYYTAARALLPSSAHILAHVLQVRGNTEEAVAVYRDLNRLQPQDGRHLICLNYALNSLGRRDEARAIRDQAVVAARAAVRLNPNDATAHSDLGRALSAQIDNLNEPVQQLKHDEAVAEFRQAIQLRPEFAWAHFNLGMALAPLNKIDEAVAAYREAVRLEPQLAVFHDSLGGALEERGNLDEAAAEFRQAIRLEPGTEASFYFRLGRILRIQGKFDEAAAEYREALRLQPNAAGFHYDFAHLLMRQGKPDEAAAEFREALRLHPDLAFGYSGLGTIEKAGERQDKAIAACREAVRLKPDSPEAHILFGQTLSEVGQARNDQGKLDEAAAEFREAARLRPDFAPAYTNLGLISKARDAVVAFREALRLRPDDVQTRDFFYSRIAQLRPDEAITQFRELIRLRPDDAEARRVLAVTLRKEGRLVEAAVEFREAIRRKPDDALTHCGLGHVLRMQGQYGSALEEYRTGHALASRQPGFFFETADWVREAETLLAMGKRVPAILRGDDRPKDNAECLAVARLAYDKALHAAAARLWKEALDRDPKLAADRLFQRRYNAACMAALAGCGQSKDNPPPDEAARRQLRDRARVWLAAELDYWAKFLQDKGPQASRSVVGSLQYWKVDADLAGIRDPGALTKLSDAEQQAWRALWVDVDTLLKRAQGP